MLDYHCVNQRSLEREQFLKTNRIAALLLVAEQMRSICYAKIKVTSWSTQALP
ncbi:hypothetical protein Ljor_1851 [Legionella jordanis]|uniref:Uncharacterized protein n=1 Tax=Legionella jordanis TaxID=456 RepID=A0A0W0VD52_9GAMM|nr:hypothetical protein Ljor_1851 [Legionella jordanis]VEH13514.1 Uncharacterised protein [Legionella jordanis]